MDSVEPLINIVYWLALSIWFGGSVFIAIAAPIIFTELAEQDPTLPRVLSVNLDGEHATLLGGELVSKLLDGLWRVTVFCLIALAVTLVSQWVLIILQRDSLGPAIVRTSLLIAAGGVAYFNATRVRPRATTLRSSYVDAADDPEKAEPLRESFNKAQGETVLMLQIEVFVLLGLVAFSALN